MRSSRSLDVGRTRYLHQIPARWSRKAALGILSATQSSIVHPEGLMAKVSCLRTWLMLSCLLRPLSVFLLWALIDDLTILDGTVLRKGGDPLKPFSSTIVRLVTRLPVLPRLPDLLKAHCKMLYCSLMVSKVDGGVLSKKEETSKTTWNIRSLHTRLRVPCQALQAVTVRSCAKTASSQSSV